MLKKMTVVALALAVGLPAMAVGSGGANAEPEWRDRAVRKYERQRIVKKRKWRDDSYAARAHDLDPAGDYKDYPDWARVALSPKYDRGRR